MGRFIIIEKNNEEENYKYNIRNVLKAVEVYLSTYYRSSFRLIINEEGNARTYEIIDQESNHSLFNKTYDKSTEFTSLEDLMGLFNNEGEICNFIEGLIEFNDTSFGLEFIAKYFISKKTIRLFDLLNEDNYNPGDFLLFICMLINSKVGNIETHVVTTTERDVVKESEEFKIISAFKKNSLMDKNNNVLASVSSDLSTIWVFEYDDTLGLRDTQVSKYPNYYNEEAAASLVDGLITYYPFLESLKRAILERNNVSIGEILSPYCIMKG